MIFTLVPSPPARRKEKLTAISIVITAAMMIQELGAMRVKPGLDIMDAATPEGKILIQAWRTVTKKPGGPSRVYWGLEEDNPLRIWAFFDWNSVEQHNQFATE